MARALDQAEKQSYQLITLTYGDPTNPQQALYTDWPQAVQGGFVSVPQLEIELPANHGVFQEQKLVLKIPKVDAFIARAAKLLPHSPIYLRLDDVTIGTFAGDTATSLTFFRGRVVRTVDNKDGNPDVVAFECLSRKSRLDVALGISCNSNCSWTLFGFGCRAHGLVQISHDLPVTIVSALGKVATIAQASFTTPTSPGGDITHFWNRGYLTKDGAILSIRDWDSADPTQVHCRRTVPPEWIGLSVLAVPGCPKTIEACRGTWDNEAANGSFGYGMLDYNPFFEDPA